MAGIDDIKLWRSEPPIGDWMKFNPNHPTLGWKYPYQGRWFTGDLDFVRGWMGADNIIKELDIKSPIPLAKQFQGPPEQFWEWKHPTYAPKTITELVRDQKILKNWIPTHGMGSGLDKLHQGSGILANYADKGDKITKLEQYLRWIDQGDHPRWLTMTPPKEIADKSSVNIYESIMKNLRKPKNFMTLYENRLGNIFKIPKKIKYLNQLKKAGVPMHSGIPWSTIGQRIINNPFTRTAGWLGNVALAGQTLSDVYAGTNLIGDMATTINKWAGVPFKDDGTVQTNIKDYKASLPKPKKYAMPPKGAAGFNSGGIASLVI